jgi:dihydroneopterin aldolase
VNNILDRYDHITIKGIRATGYHGVFEHERRDGQEFVVDLVLAVDTRKAAKRDDLHRTVDYGTVAQVVVDVIGGEPVNLIETLAQRIADEVLRHDRVSFVQVTVHKPSAPVPVPFDDIAVTILRAR